MLTQFKLWFEFCLVNFLIGYLISCLGHTYKKDLDYSHLRDGDAKPREVDNLLTVMNSLAVTMS